jgi:hypothetical protein
MSSGAKTLVMNPLERALSTDINRLQNFADASVAEVLRAILNTKVGFDDVNAGALYIPNTSQGNPLAGEVLSGLLFAPTGGGTSASVGAGVVAVFDPDTIPSTDDSQYKVITDSGTVTATLNLTSNSSGLLRIDVVECSRVQPDNVLETDSRDVYVPSSGTFTSVTVNKVAQSQMQYRIRTGTAGSGFPGTAQGWLPLAVISVPTGSSVWDTCTMWDVRPLLEDRVYALGQSVRDLPKVERCMVNIDATNHAGMSQLTGVIEAELQGRKLGGNMMSSCPQGTGGGVGLTADALYIDLDDTKNQSAGTSIPTTGFNYVYVSAPFGLPRWAKYTKGPSGRVPRSPRGILIASTTPPDLAYGTPHGGSLILPPCLQNSGNTAVDTAAYPPASVCVVTRIGTSSSSPKGGMVASGRQHWANGPTPTNTASIGSFQATFTLTPNVDFPAHARALYFQITATFSNSGTTSTYQLGPGNIILENGLGTVVGVQTPQGSGLFGGAYTGTLTYIFTVRVPLLSYYELVGTPGTSTPGNASTLALVWTVSPISFTGSTLALATAVGQANGWELMDAD